MLKKFIYSMFCIILISILVGCTAKNCDHVFSSWRVINEATCIDYGLEERSCNKCGQIDSRQTNPTGKHQYEFSHENKGQCENPSVSIFVCVNCGHTKEEKGETVSHQYQERVLIEATCATEGIKLIECINCGYSYEEKIEKTNHDYSIKETINSNCHESGYEVYECNGCSNTYNKTLDKTTHNFQYSTTIEPGCLTDGYDEYICSNCWEVEQRNIVPANGNHSLTCAATNIKCGEYGYVTYSCEHCPYTEEKYELSSYTDHNFVDGICSNCNSTIYKFEFIDGYAHLVDIYDKDIEELVVPYDDGNGNRVMIINQIDWSKFKNLKLIKFNDLIRFDSSNFSGMESLEEVHIWDLQSWVENDMFTYAYNNPLSNGAKLYVNGEEITKVDISDFDIIRPYAFAGIIAEVLEYKTTELVSSTAFEGATFDLANVYRKAFNIADCNIDTLVFKCEEVNLNVIGLGNVNKIYVSEYVKRIEGDASNLKQDIYVNDIKDWLTIDLYSPIFDEDTKLYVNDELAEIIITPENVTRIGDYNLNGADFVKILSINECVEEFGEHPIDCENLEDLYYYPKNLESYSYKALIAKNLKNLLLGDNVRTTAIIDFESTLDEVIVPDNIENLALRGHVKNLYVNSNKWLENGPALPSVDYDNAIIGENVDRIHPANFGRIYDKEYTNHNYSITVLNEDITFTTSEIVSDINGVITVKAPVQLLKQFGASVVYDDVIVTGEGSAIINGMIKNKVTLEKGVTSIQIKDDYYSHYNDKYTLEVLGDEIEFIDTFKKCQYLNFINLNALFSSNYTSGNPLSDGAILTYNGNEIKELIVPAEITSLPDKIFENFELSKINLNEVEVIGNSSFKFSKIKEIITTKSLKEINSYAFAYSDLEKINIPESLEKIGDYAFVSTSINEFIPNSSIEIGNYAFSNCTNLKTVNFNGYAQNLGESVFERCGIETLVVSAGTTNYTGAFSMCENIKEIDVPKLETQYPSFLYTQVPFKLTIRSGSFWPIVNSDLKELVLGSETNVVSNSIQADGLLKITIEEGATVDSNCINFNKTLKLVEIINLTDSTINTPTDVRTKTNLSESDFEVLNDLVIYNNDGTNYIVDYIGTDTVVDLSKLPVNTNYIISKYCFGYRSADESPSSYNIEKFIIGDNIVKIEDFALAYNSISELFIPDSVEYISSSAFAYNPLTDVSIDECNPTYDILNGNILENESKTLIIGTNGNIDNSITAISDYAFSGKLITEVNIQENITSIGIKAFDRCYYIEEFVYNTSITSEHFNSIKISYYETPLTTVIIGENVTELPAYFMANSSGIKEIIFNCTNPTVGNETFNNCNNLVEVTFNNEFINIGQRMFKSCKNLTTINTEYVFNMIGYQAFADCVSLEDITPLLDVNYIYDNAFSNCGTYTNINLDLTNVKYIAKGAFSSFRPTIDVLTIDSIVDKGFKSSNAPITKLTDIFGTYGTMINKIIYTGTTLTEKVFEDYYYVDVVEAPNVKIVEAYVFSGCSSLESIYIPLVEEISDNAFNNISYIKEINLPETITSLGTQLFVGCDSLESITFPYVGKKDLDINEYGVEQLFGLYFESTGEHNSKDGYVNVKQIHIKDKHNNQGIYYFFVPQTLRKIIILDGKLGHSTFKNFSMVEEIIIESEEVDVIPTQCFLGCKSLKNVEFNSDYTTISPYAFMNCESLESFVVPNSCEAIDGSAFMYTPKLASIIVDANNPNYYSNNMNAIVEKTTNKLIVGCKNTIMDSTVKIIGDSAFKGSSELYELLIPSSLESFEGYDHFYDCANLTVFKGSSNNFYTSGNVLYQRTEDNGVIIVRAGKGVEKIVEGVTGIKNNAFENVFFTNLTIVLPSTINYVEQYAFADSCTFDKIEFTNYSGTWYIGYYEVDLSFPVVAAREYNKHYGDFTKK